MNLTDLTRFPVNTRGYTVVPCIPLEYDNMHESMIGLKVTVGLGPYEEYGPTDSGIINGFDESKIHIKIGSKVKKFEYDPMFIQLQVYQFEKRILFSNERVSEAELASSNKDFYNDSAVREKAETPSPTPTPQKKESDDVTTPTPKKQQKKRKPKQQKKESTPAPQPKAKQETKTEYVPKFGIQWS